MEGAGPPQAQDSGVETEFDIESNDSSMSSVSVGHGPLGGEPGAARPEEEISSVSPEPPPAPHSSPSPHHTPAPHSSPSSHHTSTSPEHFPRPSPREEGAGVDSLRHGPGSSGINNCHGSRGMGEDSVYPTVEDGYLGDCSSDGGNEKNFPLPADWLNQPNSCTCHPSRHSLPPSPLQQVQLDTSPPAAPSMEDMDPPAGLQFSALTPAGSEGGIGYGYQVLNHRERAQTTLRTKIRATGFRSKYNAHVGDDWSRIKTAIADRKLRIAANTNNVELVEKLCSNGANVRCYDEHRRTPLHFAAAMGYSEVAEILLKHGADPNQKDKLGNTALHLAACTNHVPVVTLLLRAGTDITTIDNNGRTPMQLAQAKLKILQRSTSTHAEMSKVKSEVSSVLDMMKEYLKKVLESRDTTRSGNSEAYTQLIDSFSQRLNLHTSHSDLSNDLSNLLQSLGTLSLSNQE